MKKGLKILLVLMLFLYFPKVKAITITTDPSMTYGSGYQLVTNTGDFRVYIEGVGEYDNSQFAAYKIIFEGDFYERNILFYYFVNSIMFV